MPEILPVFYSAKFLLLSLDSEAGDIYTDRIDHD